jgi:hypothetical protein
MTAERDSILPIEWLQKAKPFKPFARYNHVMDQVIYLDENAAHRADRVDAFLTLLWAPDEFRLIGFKLKGFRRLFETLKSVSENIDESDFVPFTKLLELAALASWSEIAQKADGQRLQRRYETAKKFIEDRVQQQQIRVSDLQLEAA